MPPTRPERDWPVMAPTYKQYHMHTNNQITQKCMYIHINKQSKNTDTNEQEIEHTHTHTRTHTQPIPNQLLTSHQKPTSMAEAYDMPLGPNMR